MFRDLLRRLAAVARRAVTVSLSATAARRKASSARWTRRFFAGVGRDAVTGLLPETVFAMFQLTFAIITPALVIGGFAERMRFSAVLWFSALWLLLVYVPICHWVWGGGWLAKLGVLDFAGGIVVHINAGVAALVAALVLGKRRGFPSSPCRRTACR